VKGEEMKINDFLTLQVSLFQPFVNISYNRDSIR
jgi:hypothetical protein